MRAPTLLLALLATACTEKPAPPPANEPPKDQLVVGVVTGVEEGTFNRCFVRPDGEEAPRDLWAASVTAFVACRELTGQRVRATYTTSEMFLPTEGATKKVSLLHRIEAATP